MGTQRNIKFYAIGLKYANLQEDCAIKYPESKNYSLYNWLELLLIFYWKRNLHIGLVGLIEHYVKSL